MRMDIYFMMRVNIHSHNQLEGENESESLFPCELFSSFTKTFILKVSLVALKKFGP